MAAEWLHALSRPNHPFVAINCAGYPDTLLDAELFGHEKGAFTGAEARSMGLFASAGEGTIFLDEIGDMPIQQQAKLLRAIETKKARRLGTTGEYEIHARIIAATNIDLCAAVEAKRFRADLFWRLGLPVRIPPLDERREDIAELVEHWMHHWRGPPLRLSDGTIAWLASESWPGNVRELFSVLERCVSLANGAVVDASAIATIRARTSGTRPILKPLHEVHEETERRAIERALAFHDGNISATATALGVGRNRVAKVKREAMKGRRS